MADQYLSKYSNDKYVSAAQYITELVCENKAVKDKCDLHYRFWTTKKWALYYRNQIASAHKLLVKYRAPAIIKALRDTDGKKIYSLRAPHLIDIIQRYESLLDSENKTLTKDLDRSERVSFRSQSHKTILSKLKDIDNES